MQPDSGLLSTDKKIENLSNQIALLSQQFRAILSRTKNQLRTSTSTRNQEMVQDGRVVVQNVQGRQYQNQRNIIQNNSGAGNGGVPNRAGYVNQGQGRQVKCYNCNGLGHIARNCTLPKRP